MGDDLPSVSLTQREGSYRQNLTQPPPELLDVARGHDPFACVNHEAGLPRSPVAWPLPCLPACCLQQGRSILLLWAGRHALG